MKRRFASHIALRVRGLVGLAAGAMALSACGGVIPGGTAPSQSRAENERVQVGTGRDYPRARREGSASSDRAGSSRQSLGVGSSPSAYLSHPGDRSCFADLSASGARFSRVPDTYAAPGCNKLGTVKLTALSGDATQFGVSNLGAVKCETAKTFSAWARFGVDRAARQILGSPLARIETMGSYACRNVLGTGRRSAHATGNAIDVSAFILANGQRISLKGDWDEGSRAEREFLRVVHKSACKRFGTVLGPDYNKAHADHFHLEGSGRQFCR
ncbi:MAG: extensin family protein [Pseudomonadota bacterium]